MCCPTSALFTCFHNYFTWFNELWYIMLRSIDGPIRPTATLTIPSVVVPKKPMTNTVPQEEWTEAQKADAQRLTAYTPRIAKLLGFEVDNLGPWYLIKGTAENGNEYLNWRADSLDGFCPTNMGTHAHGHDVRVVAWLKPRYIGFKNKCRDAVCRTKQTMLWRNMPTTTVLRHGASAGAGAGSSVVEAYVQSWEMDMGDDSDFEAPLPVMYREEEVEEVDEEEDEEEEEEDPRPPKPPQLIHEPTKYSPKHIEFFDLVMRRAIKAEPSLPPDVVAKRYIRSIVAQKGEMRAEMAKDLLKSFVSYHDGVLSLTWDKEDRCNVLLKKDTTELSRLHDLTSMFLHHITYLCSELYVELFEERLRQLQKELEKAEAEQPVPTAEQLAAQERVNRAQAVIDNAGDKVKTYQSKELGVAQRLLEKLKKKQKEGATGDIQKKLKQVTANLDKLKRSQFRAQGRASFDFVLTDHQRRDFYAIKWNAAKLHAAIKTQLPGEKPFAATPGLLSIDGGKL